MTITVIVSVPEGGPDATVGQNSNWSSQDAETGDSAYGHSYSNTIVRAGETRSFTVSGSDNNLSISERQEWPEFEAVAESMIDAPDSNIA